MYRRTLMAAIAALAAGSAASAQSISTIFDGGNRGSVGGAVYFDVTVNAEPLTITGFDVNTTQFAGTTFGFSVYTLVGSSSGNQSNPGAWTLRTTGIGTAAGTNLPSEVVLDAPFDLDAGTQYGMAIVLESPGQLAAQHEYTNGTGANQHFSNVHLTLDLGSATNIAFSGAPFEPRVWNGTIHYMPGDPTATGACCLNDGSCQVLTSGDCFAQGGAYQGAGSTCAGVNCPQPAACCFVGGACDVLLESQCTAQNGTFHASAATCAAANCPDFPLEQWVTVEPAPEARSRAAGAIIGDTFYFMGGEATGGNRHTTCWKLDIPNNTWSPIADMPSNFIGFGGVSNVDAAALGTDVYLVGGWDGANGARRVLRYDTVADTWEEIASDPYPTTIYANAVVALDGKLYSIGGSTASGVYATDSYVYDPAAAPGTRWTAIAPLPEQKQYLAGAAIDGKIYVVGGIQTTAIEFSSAHVYDPATNQWTPLPSMSSLRGGPGLYDLGGEPYAVAGGWASYLSTTEVLSGGSWSSGPAVNTGLRTFAHAGNERWLVKAGGWAGTFMSTTEVFKPASGCYADCDGNETLNIDDFLCFINQFATQDPYADCDGNQVFNIDDFLCFINEFAQGCP